MTWRHQYDEASDAEEREASAWNNPGGEPSMTVQSHTDDVNLNTIVARFGITDGAIPPAAADPRYFGDFTDSFDLKDALERIRTAYAHFDSLPAPVRQRFNNDPQELYQWVNDPANVDEAVELKILSKEGATQVPKTADQKRQIELEALNARITALQSAVPATTPPTTSTTTTPATPQ